MYDRAHRDNILQSRSVIKVLDVWRCDIFTRIFQLDWTRNFSFRLKMWRVEFFRTLVLLISTVSSLNIPSGKYLYPLYNSISDVLRFRDARPVFLHKRSATPTSNVSCSVALVADFKFYQTYVIHSSSYILSVMNDVREMFQRENITLWLNYLYVANSLSSISGLTDNSSAYTTLPTLLSTFTTKIGSWSNISTVLNSTCLVRLITASSSASGILDYSNVQNSTLLL